MGACNDEICDSCRYVKGSSACFKECSDVTEVRLSTDENDGHFWWCAVNTADTQCNCADKRRTDYYQSEEAVGMFQQGWIEEAWDKNVTEKINEAAAASDWCRSPASKRAALLDEATASGAAADARRTLLREAESIVSGPRAASYGPPEDNFRRIADFWSTYLRERLPHIDIWLQPNDVATMMILLKVARLIESPNHKDSYTDIAGYAACGYSTTEQPA